MKKKSILTKGEIEILAVPTQKRSMLHSTPGARGKTCLFSTSKASPTSPQMLLEQNIFISHHQTSIIISLIGDTNTQDIHKKV